MEDIFATRDDKEEAFVFRYPLYERFLFIMGIGAAGAAALGRNYIRDQFTGNDLMKLAAYALIALFVGVCLWISFRAWQAKIIVSPTAFKAKYLAQGIERISWDHIAEIVYKWRPLSHMLIFVGTDGSRIRFRSSISGYDRLLHVIRTNAPAHILDQLDDLLGEEEEEEEEEPKKSIAPEAATPPAEPPRAQEEGEDEEK